MSKVELKAEEISTLSKGLKYAPKVKLNTFQSFIEIQKFTKQLNLKKYFAQNPIMMNGVTSSSYIHTPTPEMHHCSTRQILIIHTYLFLKRWLYRIWRN